MNWRLLLGIVLLGLVVYMMMGEDTKRTMQRTTRGYWSRHKQYVTRDILLHPIYFVLLGVLMRDPVISSLLIALGLGIAYARIREAIIEAGKIKLDQILQLVLSFRAAYYLEPAAFKALANAAQRIEDGQLKNVSLQTVEVFFTTSSTTQAFEYFREHTESVVLDQFMYILEMSEAASNEAMEEALQAFVKRLQGHQELERQVNTSLANSMSQTRFMQSFLMGLCLLVALVPGLRRIWVSNLMWRTAYIVIMAMIVGTSYYIERQIANLRAEIR